MRQHVAALLCIIAALELTSQETCIDRSSEIDTLQMSSLFKELPDSVGPINQKEISGIAPSIKYPGHFWAVNDSGNGAVLYLYSELDASLKGLFILNGITNTDWEDLSIHKSESGNGMIYIPDFGDNKAKRKVYTVYKVPEPELADKKINNLFVDPEQYRFTYSNGARDAEAFAIDPTDGVSYIISKREKEVFVYALDFNNTDSVQTLDPIGQLPYNNTVSADFSQDGKHFLLKTYTNIYLWTREDVNEPFCEMISKSPQSVNYLLEPQGESICFIDGGFITVSEERFGIQPVLYKYSVKD